MSIGRRLTRILRAQLGAFRDDPLEPEEAEVSGDASSGGRAARGQAEATDAEEPTPDVPPEVAKAYRALEVPVGSGREAVKKGYRRMMKQYHQDRFQNDPEKRDVAGEVSKRLNDAYERVLDYLDDSSG